VVRSVLSGDPGPVRDIVLLNAAAGLAAAGGLQGLPVADVLDKTLAEGLSRAAEAIDSGAASQLLTRWSQTSQRLATPRPRT
jgi:anthranilate phosphoribosyltransferase